MINNGIFIILIFFAILCFSYGKQDEVIDKIKKIFDDLKSDKILRYLIIILLIIASIKMFLILIQYIKYFIIMSLAFIIFFIAVAKMQKEDEDK